MRKFTYILFTLLLAVNIVKAQNENKMDLYDFSVKSIDGTKFDMSDLKGKKVMIVNVASKCGLTPQYEELQQLYEQYKDLGFIIIGFPANNFNNQEPGSNQDIKEFCDAKYSITFPVMSKIDVVGENKAPIYQWLTEKDKNGVIDQEVTWNFQKYLIDRNGNLIAVVMPKESPKSKEIIAWIKDGK